MVIHASSLVELLESVPEFKLTGISSSCNSTEARMFRDLFQMKPLLFQLLVQFLREQRLQVL